MNKLRKLSIIFLILTMLFTVSGTQAFAVDIVKPEVSQVTSQSEYFDSVRAFIKQKYSGALSEKELQEASTLKGMFETLDDYSAFYDLNEINAVFGMLEGSVEGVGIQVSLEEKAQYITILKVYRNSPAWKAGVLSGDRIAEVDGKSVADQSLEQVVAKVKGPAGTKVKLGLLRQGASKIITLEMSRARVDIPSVHYEIRDSIGYILLDSFSSNTYSGVDEALTYFDSKKISRVVLDLRNNPGGLVDQAVRVAQRFVPKGLITTLDYKDESETDQTYYSSLSKLKYDLCVLVNENSASAAEILTGAIKDTKAGVVIGTKTFGKAKVQTFYPILNLEAFKTLNTNREVKSVNGYDFGYPFDSQLAGWGKMTIGLYRTPNGDSIDLKGIEPNVLINDKKTDDSVPVNLLEPLTVTVKPKLGNQYVDVFYAEHILKLLNYNVDEPDMVMDQKTVDAIKKFQKDNKVYSYGVMDFCTQELLNGKLAAMKQTKDIAYAKAAELLN